PVSPTPGLLTRRAVGTDRELSLFEERAAGMFGSRYGELSSDVVEGRTEIEGDLANVDGPSKRRLGVSRCNQAERVIAGTRIEFAYDDSIVFRFEKSLNLTLQRFELFLCPVSLL